MFTFPHRIYATKTSNLFSGLVLCVSYDFRTGGVGPMADKSRVNILIRLPTDGNKVSARAEN